MIFGFAWPTLLTYVLTAFFLANGVINLMGKQALRDGFARWGFPAWWHLVNGAVLLVAGVLLAYPPTQFLGFALGALECLAVFATLARHRDWAHFPPSVILLVLLALAYWGTYGLWPLD
jgi:uncharacterized membrane protein HdeD (DUF308 family)